MSPSRRVASALCLLAGLTLAFGSKYLWTRYRVSTAGPIAVPGKRLPPLVVSDPAGNWVDLTALAHGRRTVIAFYSASCHSCQAVLPELRPFPPRFNLFLVSEGTKGASEDSAALGFGGALLFYDRGSVLSRSFPMSPLPTILFVNEEGVLIGGAVGGQSRDRVRARLNELEQGEL